MQQTEQALDRIETNQMDPWLASLLKIREKRGIQVDPTANERFIKVRRVIMGVNELVEAGEQPEVILAKLNSMNVEVIGFALEGVGLALAKQDANAPQAENRVETFVAGTSIFHQIMVFLGVGAFLGTERLPLDPHIQPYLNPFNPLRVWSILDGYGFQHGMLYWEEYLDGQPIPEGINGYNARIFDQGLGRSIWVLDAGDVNRVPNTIAAFPTTRQPDLWAGVGYACTSIGAVKREALEALAAGAGAFLPALVQGSVCAARFRRLLGTPAPHIEMVSDTLSEIAKTQATTSANQAVEKLPTIGSTPLQSLWQFYRSYLTYDQF